MSKNGIIGVFTKVTTKHNYRITLPREFAFLVLLRDAWRKQLGIQKVTYPLKSEKNL